MAVKLKFIDISDKPLNKPFHLELQDAQILSIGYFERDLLLHYLEDTERPVRRHQFYIATPSTPLPASYVLWRYVSTAVGVELGTPTVVLYSCIGEPET